MLTPDLLRVGLFLICVATSPSHLEVLENGASGTRLPGLCGRCFCSSRCG